jgi:hypothetical protein
MTGWSVVGWVKIGFAAAHLLEPAPVDVAACGFKSRPGHAVKCTLLYRIVSETAV